MGKISRSSAPAYKLHHFNLGRWRDRRLLPIALSDDLAIEFDGYAIARQLQEREHLGNGLMGRNLTTFSVDHNFDKCRLFLHISPQAIIGATRLLIWYLLDANHVLRHLVSGINSARDCHRRRRRDD